MHSYEMKRLPDYKGLNNRADILVICPASHKALIHEAIWRSDESSPSFSHLSIALEGLDDAEAASLDTADILRKFSGRFIVSLLVVTEIQHFTHATSFYQTSDGPHHPFMRLYPTSCAQIVFHCQ